MNKKIIFMTSLHQISTTYIDLQFLREKEFQQTIPPIKVGDNDDEITTYEMTTKALRRSVHYLSALQASDGHWPSQNSAPLYFLPPLVSTYIYTSISFMRKYHNKSDKLGK